MVIYLEGWYMNLNITFIGELVLYSMFIVGALSYYLGKRKTSNPKIATIIIASNRDGMDKITSRK